MKDRGLLILATGAYAMGCLLGCGKPAFEVSLADSPFDPERADAYLIYPGDVLLCSFPTNRDLNQEVRVRSDGRISLPYVGDVMAAHRSPDDLAQDLKHRFHGIIESSEVAVIVKAESGRIVYVGGEVNRPGMLGLMPHQTLVQALYEAGGLAETAHSGGILVMRNRVNEGTYVLKADMGQILSGEAPDVRLEPYDIVHVPPTAIAQINQFVEQYVNRMVPRVVSFPFVTELNKQPVKVISETRGPSNIPPITITRQ